MKNKAYQESHRHQPCIFCARVDSTVVGHHVRVHAGAGQKPSDAMAVPACYHCHADCHAGAIDRQAQLNNWCRYILERLTQEHGQTKAVEKLAMAYWDALNE